MARRDMYPLINAALGNTLERRLRQLRTADGLSFDEIAHSLRTEHDVVVSGETVRRWCADLEITKAEVAS